MRSNRLLGVIALILCSMGGLNIASRASRQSQQIPQARKPGLKNLDAWNGRWTTQGKLYDTAYSHAGNITIAMTCGWSAYNGYMICDHLFNGPAGKRNDLSVYTYNPEDNSYKFYSVDQTGPPRGVPLTIEGDIWSYDSEMEKDGKKILIKTINDFSKPGIVAWNTKFSEDAGAHWTQMNEGVDTKVR
jgi:hypothetical protein